MAAQFSLHFRGTIRLHNSTCIAVGDGSAGQFNLHCRGGRFRCTIQPALPWGTVLMHNLGLCIAVERFGWTVQPAMARWSLHCRNLPGQRAREVTVQAGSAPNAPSNGSVPECPALRTCHPPVPRDHQHVPAATEPSQPRGGRQGELEPALGPRKSTPP